MFLSQIGTLSSEICGHFPQFLPAGLPELSGEYFCVTTLVDCGFVRGDKNTPLVPKKTSRSGRDRFNCGSYRLFFDNGAEGATAPETLRQKDWIGQSSHLESKLPMFR